MMMLMMKRMMKEFELVQLGCGGSWSTEHTLALAEVPPKILMTLRMLWKNWKRKKKKKKRTSCGLSPFSGPPEWR